MAEMKLPGNSQGPKTPKATPQKKVAAVVQGPVKTQKQPLGKRFASTFMGDDAKGVWHYVAWDVLIPAAKDTLSEAVSQGVERLLFGEARGRSRGRRGLNSSSGGSYISYDRYSNGALGSRGPARREITRQARSAHDFDELVFEARVDADAVLEGLYTILEQYDQVTVSDLYELANVSANFTDQKWGWTDLRGTGVSRRGGNYYLDLPRPTALD